jgi:hypothetical protein
MNVSSFTRALNSFRNYGSKVYATFQGGELWDQLRKILPNILDKWSIKDECDRRGSTMVKITIPLSREIAKFLDLLQFRQENSIVS